MRSRGKILSYGDVDDRVRKLTTLFKEQELKPGDYVCLNVKDEGQLAVLYLACICNGLAAVISDPMAPSLEGIIAQVKPRLIFVDKEKLSSLPSVPGLKVITVEEAHRKTRTLLKKLLKKQSIPDSPAGTAELPILMQRLIAFEGDFPDFDSQTTAMVLFTSGTTSQSKGVELSHNSMATQMRRLIERLKVDGRSEIFNVLPLHHTDGITNGVTLALASGATLHRPGKFTIHELPAVMDYIFREGISHLFTVPTVLALINRLGEDYTDTFGSGDFKALVCSAGLLPVDLWESFQERFKVRVSNGYGLTETVSIATLCGPDESSFRIGSVGTPVAGELKVINDAGMDIPAGEQGEILIRGDLVMKGYVNNPQGTAEAFTDDWFHTGDIGRIAEDGKIEIVGRKKNIIIRGGINIHPAEIADAALVHEGVVHAEAFGMPDEIWGETVVLCIVEDSQLSCHDEDLQRFLETRLSREKLPEEIHCFADFPRGPAGKVVLPELQEQVALRRKNIAFSNDGDSLDIVIRIAASLLKLAPEMLSRSSSGNNTAGWDSLLHLNFILAVEETFATEFSPREIMAVQTLGDLVDLAEEHRRLNKVTA